jgi:hypothetical protein
MIPPAPGEIPPPGYPWSAEQLPRWVTRANRAPSTTHVSRACSAHVGDANRAPSTAHVSRAPFMTHVSRAFPTGVTSSVTGGAA